MKMSRHVTACLILISVAASCIWLGDKGNAAPSDREQLVARCSSLVAQNRFKEGAACLQPFEREVNPDRETAAAVYQLGQLYETVNGVPAEPDHALRLYRSAQRLGAIAPDIASQAGISATKLINRLRQAEEP
jgi:hypothetical protein